MTGPYVITTKTLACPCGSDPEHAARYCEHAEHRASHRAVATLEEAHREVVPLVTAGGWGGDVFPQVARALPESGGTIVLPDGTVEVRPRTWEQLATDAGIPSWGPDAQRCYQAYHRDKARKRVLDAYNAEHGSGS